MRCAHCVLSYHTVRWFSAIMRGAATCCHVVSPEENAAERSQTPGPRTRTVGFSEQDTPRLSGRPCYQGQRQAGEQLPLGGVMGSDWLS